MRGFSLRGPSVKTSKRSESVRLLLDATGLHLDPAGLSPQERLDYLQNLVGALADSHEPRCLEIRQHILRVLRAVWDGVRAAEGGNETQARRMAKKAERTLAEIQPDIFESSYFLAHQYLSRHRHLHPPGSENALAESARAAIEQFASASRALARALRQGDPGTVKKANASYNAVSNDLVKALRESPPADIGPAGARPLAPRDSGPLGSV